MIRKHGLWSLGMYRSIYNGNLKEQSLLSRCSHGVKKGEGVVMRGRKRPYPLRIINRMESALIEIRR